MISGNNMVPGWRPSRIDQGADGTLSAQGFIAPFDLFVLYATDRSPGWGNGGFVTANIVSGPLTGQWIYVAEGVTIRASVGELVLAGQKLCDPANNPYNNVFGNIEAGFADPFDPLRPLAQALAHYGGDQSPQAIAAGSAFNRVLVDLGGTSAHLSAGVAEPNWALLPADLRSALGV